MVSVANVSQLDEFDEIIDVRTPLEFREDHIPGAVNLPVLSEEERAHVGTLYKQVSSFDAKKVGAALIARNIARHLDEYFSSKPKNWRPLIYCWRGGKRSGSMAHILHEVGWKAIRLDGGYKAYRRRVIEDLATLPSRFQFRAVCGATGSGKSRFLEALNDVGAQVLDLEQLAAHRGSILGDWPNAPQPTQKTFESLIWDRLRRFDPVQYVYVEAESKKIGALRVPESLIARMWESECVLIEADMEQRIALLIEEYAHFIANPTTLLAKIDCLNDLHSGAQIARWKSLVQQKNWIEFVRELLTAHYDPAYLRSTLNHYPRLCDAQKLAPDALDRDTYRSVARQLLRGHY